MQITNATGIAIIAIGVLWEWESRVFSYGDDTPIPPGESANVFGPERLPLCGSGIVIVEGCATGEAYLLPKIGDARLFVNGEIGVIVIRDGDDLPKAVLDWRAAQSKHYHE